MMASIAAASFVNWVFSSSAPPEVMPNDHSLTFFYAICAYGSHMFFDQVVWIRVRHLYFLKAWVIWLAVW